MQSTDSSARLHPFVLWIRASSVALILLLLAAAAFWIYGVPRLRPAGNVGGAVACVGTCASAEGFQAELGAGLEHHVAAPVAPPAPDTSADPIGHLLVPSLGIDGVIYPVGTARDGSMDVTENAWTVGWWKYGIRPGSAGDSVMTCHNHWYTGEALCRDLHSVATGAEVDVRLVDGTTRRFKVDTVQTVAWNTQVNGLFDTHGPARLSIVTCGGTWDTRTQNYSLRVIITAHLAEGTA
jgi:sortase (surface protein transpeptidase)